MYYEWSQNYISCKIVHVASAPWSVRISTFTLVSHGNASTTESLNACSCRFCCKSSNSVGGSRSILAGIFVVIIL